MNLIRISESTNPFSWAVSCKIYHCTLFIYQLFPVTIICQCLKSVKSFYSDVITFSAWGFVFQASSLPAQIRDLQISDIWSNSQYSVLSVCLRQKIDIGTFWILVLKAIYLLCEQMWSLLREPWCDLKQWITSLCSAELLQISI